MTRPHSRNRWLTTTGPAAIAVAVSAAVGVTLLVHTVRPLIGDRMAPWVLGRAAGVCAYLLLVVLVMSGLLLSHPARARIRRPATATRIRAHISLAVLTLAFTVLHVVVLATDRFAHVGWWGALLPLASAYRPLATTAGVVALWSGLLAGITAQLSGRLPLRLWWPVHKVAALTLIMVWAHGVFAGSDTVALRVLYIASGGAVGMLAVSRYVSRTPADLVAELHR